jgi:hypothetical protein
MLRYYLPDIVKVFRVEPMPRNRVPDQKSLSDDASSSSIRMRRHAGKRGSLGAGLRASSVKTGT